MGLIRRGCSLFLVFFFYTWASCPIFSLASKFTIEKKKVWFEVKKLVEISHPMPLKLHKLTKMAYSFEGETKREGINLFLAVQVNF